MRPHGRAAISLTKPRALGVCDRCGFLYNHDQLQWQYEWMGTKLQNLYILVCKPCLDRPQEQLRLIMLPPDPLPIANPRPEQYVSDNAPISGIGGDPATWLQPNWANSGTFIGNMTLYGGLPAAFNGSTNKPFSQCATLLNSNPGYNNTVGVNWNNLAATMPFPSGVGPANKTYSIGSAVIYGPNDQPILRTGAAGFFLQGSNDGVSWTTLFTGATNGVPGDIISFNAQSAPFFSQHRINFYGDGLTQIGVAQIQLNITSKPFVISPAVAAGTVLTTDSGATLTTDSGNPLIAG